MKIVKIVGGGIAALLVLGFVAVSVQPDSQHIERSKIVHAAPSDVYAVVADFRQWNAWSPWAELDPAQKTTFSENPVGKGAWTTWEGNDQVGKGKMTYTEAVENEKLVEHLEFIEPFASEATVTFTFTPEGDGTKVVWAYDAEQAFMAKAMGMVMDMEAMLGGDFEKGLNKMAPLAEANAAARKKAEEEAAAAAAAAAQLATDGAPPVEGAAPPAEGTPPGAAPAAP